MYYGNRTEWSASEQSVTIRVIKHQLCYQFIVTNTKFETMISDSFNFFIKRTRSSYTFYQKGTKNTAFESFLMLESGMTIGNRTGEFCCPTRVSAPRRYLNFPRADKYRFFFRCIGNIRNLLNLKKLGAQGGPG